MRNWTYDRSEFLTPPESAAVVEVLGDAKGLMVRFWGGYEEAERGVVVMAHEKVEEWGWGLELLGIWGRFDGEKGMFGLVHELR